MEILNLFGVRSTHDCIRFFTQPFLKWLGNVVRHTLTNNVASLQFRSEVRKARGACSQTTPNGIRMLNTRT